MRVWVLLGLLLASPSWAGNIQYRLDTGNVTGASDLPLSVPDGYAVIIIDESVADMVWPIPVGCTIGQAEWSRVINADIVAADGTGLEVQPALLFFHTTSPLLTGCHVVSSWGDLKRLMDEAILTAALKEDLVQALAGVNTWKQELCPESNANTNCVAWRNSMATVNARYPGRGQGASLAADMATLVTEAYAFRDNACKANPAGGFC